MDTRRAHSFQAAATSFLALFSIVGLALYGLPLYYDHMVREFGWSRTQVTSGNALSKLLVGPLFGFIAGWIIDRFGPRRLMLAGIVMAGAALAGLGSMSALWMFYAFYLLNALGYVCGGPLPNQVLLSQWFSKGRGKAMGFAYLGIGVGGAVVLNLGVPAAMSGHPKYNIHANDIDFQIEADFIGLMSPGLPRYSNDYGLRVGRVMGYGDGLYGGIFVSGMYAAAFFESDVRRVVEQGLACLPPQSRYARVIRDVLDWSAAYPDDWKKVWQLVQDKWDREDPCPDGALRPFNIDAAINGAYVALGLLCGRGDFGRTVEIATRAGQDSDCNPSTAAGILGVMVGYSGIPDSWKSGIPAVAGWRFAYTRSSLDDICHSTLTRALALVRRAGGQISDATIVIPVQAPAPAPLEQWDMGVPDRRVAVDDAAWRFTGFTASERGEGSNRAPARRATTAGAEAVLTFTGSAVAVIGDLSQEGGRADVFLDGTPARAIDAYVPERTYDNDMWHAYDLKPGEHTLRIVTRSDADPRAKGRAIAILGAVVYRGKNGGQ